MQDKIEQSSEDYLEAILMLKEEKGYVRSVDVAEKLEVTTPSVCYATKKLKERGCITMDKSGFITLTDTGMRKAEKVLNRHNVLTDYFIMLGVNPKIAADDACRVEHCISEETFEAIRKQMDK
ncbi:MAG: metal-dependent transcriptional regulator [Lachnospiraceae bacterium]|nr:metal-dependent transcriptional regulator [Lachnospiraceae bacterium]